jgi:two-component system cell cycle sensor histidine kinase/response regulator CckA
VTRVAQTLAPRLWILPGLGAIALLAALVPGSPAAALFLVTLGATFWAVAGIVAGLLWHHRQRHRLLENVLRSFTRDDRTPTLIADGDGAVDLANDAARDALDAGPGRALTDVLSPLCLEPATILYRMQNRAQALGAAREGVPVPGGRLDLSVHQVGAARFMWRIDEVRSAPEPARAGEDIAMPMMRVSGAGTILDMNEALRRLLGGAETTLDRVFTDLPLRPGHIHVLQGARGPVSVRVAEMARGADEREVYLVPDHTPTTIDAGGWPLIEALPIPLLKLDRSGEVAAANARARRLLGSEEAVGRPLAALVEGLGRPVGDWLDEAWRGRNLGRTETVRAALPDEERFLQIALERIQVAGTDVLIVVLNDATEFKSLEHQFVQSQKMQAIGQLAGGVAHDFNNLLTAITGHCDLLLLRHEEEDPDYADLKQISQNTNRAAALVGQLLAFSRKQTLRPDVIDLSDSMADLVHLLGRLVGETVQLDYVHDADVHPVRADARQLEQVVMNLVVNARDAMPEGGTVRLEVHNVTLTQPLERDRVKVPRGDYVTIRVIDTGVGIPPSRLEKIFEPFHTTKLAGKGTGLGLSMAYGIVKQSGGFIFVDSVEGAGTTFTLYFPVHDLPQGAGESPEDAPAASLPQPTHGGGGDDPAGTVLLVEDEGPVRAFASRALSLRGHTVLEAENAETALALLEDPELAVDVVVTDVIMPGMDGPTWVSRALEDRPGVKVVFVSGYAEESVADHQMRIPNAVFLPKPFSLKELAATVADQLH